MAAAAGDTALHGAEGQVEHGAEVLLGRPDGSAVRLVGCYHVSPHNTFTRRLTPEMLDEVLIGLRR